MNVEPIYTDEEKLFIENIDKIQESIISSYEKKIKMALSTKKKIEIHKQLTLELNKIGKARAVMESKRIGGYRVND